MTHKYDADVVVVGAGLAGLAAARELTRTGLTVRVLEARPRNGGRLHTEWFDGALLERGAQWIGRGHTRLRRLCRELGIQLVAPPRGGRDVDERTRLTGQDWASAAAFAIRAQLTGTSDSARERLDGIPASRWLTEAVRSRPMAARLRDALESELCVSLDSLSAFEMLRIYRSSAGVRALGGTETFFFRDGASALIDRLATGLRVDTEWRVTALDPDDHGVTVRSDRGVLRARRVIVAVPPQLHEGLAPAGGWNVDRQTALARVVPGDVIKAGLVYESRWWAARGFSGRVALRSGPFQYVIDSSAPGSGRLIAFSSAGQAAEFRTSGSGLRTIVEAVFGPGPEPLGEFTADWSAEPFSQGGYASSRGIAGWPTSRDVLAAPSGRVHFAGTETAREWNSFMEGALESAERAAAEVLAAT